MKSALNKLCTSGLRNCGIPSLALNKQDKEQVKTTERVLKSTGGVKTCLINQNTSDVITSRDNETPL